MKTGMQLSHKYTFNLNEQKKGKGISGSGLDFENINKGFYDEIEENDIKIQNNKKNLKKIKTNAIKECVYSNKDIPDTWKNKLNYQDEVLEIFSKDENFLAYLGRGHSMKDSLYSGSNETARTKNMSSTAYTNFPRIHKGTLSSISNDTNGQPSTGKDDTDNPTIKSSSNRTKFLMTKNRNELGEKEIISILEDFRNAYPLKPLVHSPTDSVTQEKVSSPRGEEQPQIFNKTFAGSFKGGIGTAMKNAIYGGIHTLKNMKLHEKQEMFKTSIFTKLIPPKSRSLSSRPVVDKKKEEAKTKYGPFLNFDYEAFNKKIEVTNPLVKKQLESINFFGPYYSYCPPCRNRNMEFYKNLEPAQCIEIIKCIKRSKGKSVIFNKDKLKEKKQKKQNDILAE